MKHEPTEDEDEDLMFIEGKIIRKERSTSNVSDADMGAYREEHYRSGKKKVNTFIKKTNMIEKKARGKNMSLKKIGKDTLKLGKKVGKKGIKVTKKTVKKTKKVVKKKK